MISVHGSVCEVPRPAWDDLLTPETSDLGHGYLAFRETLEPGRAVVLVRGGNRLVGAVHAVHTTAESGLFSHPWKMLAREQFLRLGEDEDEEETTRRHRELVPDWPTLSATLGQALVVRGFDRSAVLLHPGLDRHERERTLAALISALKRESGVVILPFVSRDDTELAAVLTEEGFARGTVTAAARFDLGAHQDHAAFLSALPGRFRRKHVKDAEALAQAGLSVTQADPEADLEQIVELEALTTTRHGGHIDQGGLLAARRRLVRSHPRSVRLPVIRRDGRIVACGVHLVAHSSYHILGYGADGSPESRGAVYPCVTFHDPISYCLKTGVAWCRLGLESLQAKYQRGASVEARDMWGWVGDPAHHTRLAATLRLLDGRNTAYLSRFTGGTHAAGATRPGDLTSEDRHSSAPGPVRNAGLQDGRGSTP